MLNTEHNSRRPLIDFEKLRGEVSIGQVLDLLDWRPVARSGPQLRGPCPIHQSQSERSRSFAVHTEKNAFCCQACGAQGNQLDLAAAAFELPLYAAARELCRRLNVSPPLRD